MHNSSGHGSSKHGSSKHGSALFWRLGAIVCASGFCSLVYQVAWFRLLRLTFGASTAANAAVVAIFMGGLGLGGVLLGRRVVRSRNPLALYAWIEIGIAVTAAASPLLADLARAVYLGLGGVAELGLFGATIVRLVLATLVLGACTTLMGGTLPAATQALENQTLGKEASVGEDAGRRRVAWLYGINTLGAVTGALVATFASIELLGIRQSLWVACLLNLLLALAARSLARRSAASSATESSESSESSGSSEPSAEEAGIETRPISPRARVLLPAAGLVGFVFFLMELVWYRMLAPILGGSSYTFGLILALALAGIALGGLLYALGGEDRRPSFAALAATCGLEAAFLGLPFALGDRLAFLAVTVRPLEVIGFGGLVAGWVLVASIVVLPASIVAGYQFPLLVGLLGDDRRSVGEEVGLVYAWNTWGAILGSLAGGFGLLPLLTAPTLWRASTVFLALLGVFLLFAGPRLLPAGDRPTTPRGIARLALVGAILAVVLATLPGPSAFWRHTAIGVGRVEADFDGPNGLRDLLHVVRRGVLAEADGVESSVALVRDNDLALIVNGKSDGSARGDAATNVTSALVSTALHPDPRRVLVIGLGTGVTAGWFAQVPSVERVDVVELEPAVVRFAEEFSAVHFDVLHDPKVNLIYGDGREHVLAHAGEYDIIFSEPSNPYRVGVADLFSRDFYRAVIERLGERGIFLQWLQGYDVDPRVIQGVYATLDSVFPSIETWRVHRKDLLLLATREPIVHDLERVRERVALEPWRSGFRQVWGVEGVEGFYSGFVGDGRLAEILAAGSTLAVSTDDRPTIEFGFARSVGRVGEFDLGQLYRLASAVGADHPRLATRFVATGAPIDWRRVTELAAVRETLAAFSSAGATVGESTDRLEGDAARRQAARRAWSDGDLADAARLWASQAGGPVAPLDRMMLAELVVSLPEMPLPEVPLQEVPLPEVDLVADLAAEAPTEAAALRARRAFETGDVESATNELLDAFERLRVDAWVHVGVMQRAFQLAKSIAEASPAHGRSLFAALDEPFAAHLFEEVRLATRVNLAGRLDFAGLCAEAFLGYEPYPVWNERFLEARRRCYETTPERSDLARRAADDLARWRADAVEPFRVPTPTPGGAAAP